MTVWRKSETVGLTICITLRTLWVGYFHKSERLHYCVKQTWQYYLKVRNVLQCVFSSPPLPQPPCCLCLSAVCLSVCLSICLSVSLSVSLSLSLSLSLSVCLSVCLPPLSSLSLSMLFGYFSFFFLLFSFSFSMHNVKQCWVSVSVDIVDL